MDRAVARPAFHKTTKFTWCRNMGKCWILIESVLLSMAARHARRTGRLLTRTQPGGGGSEPPYIAQKGIVILLLYGFHIPAHKDTKAAFWTTATAPAVGCGWPTPCLAPRWAPPRIAPVAFARRFLAAYLHAPTRG